MQNLLKLFLYKIFLIFGLFHTNRMPYIKLLLQGASQCCLASQQMLEMTLPNENGCFSMPETQTQRNQCQTMARGTNLSENIGDAEVHYYKPAAALTFCLFVYLVNTDTPSIFFNLPTPLSSV